jgi:hypothetical protein
MRQFPFRAAAAAAALCAGGAAHAAEPIERAFCPARPGKVTPTCTVDAGRVQLEVDAADYTADRSGEVKTGSLVLGSSQLRIGLDPNTELQLAWTPYQRATSHGGGPSSADSGVGDAVAGVKFNLTGNKDDFGGALQPFVKLPVAPRPLGNGMVEGGVVMPISKALAGGWSLGLSPELDVLADGGGSSHHAAGAFVVGLGHALSPTVGFGAELWAAQDFVAHASTRATADVLLTWAPAWGHDLQFDVGANLGLTAAAPDAQVYMGIAKRF